MPLLPQNRLNVVVTLQIRIKKIIEYSMLKPRPTSALSCIPNSYTKIEISVKKM